MTWTIPSLRACANCAAQFTVTVPRTSFRHTCQAALRNCRTKSLPFPRTFEMCYHGALQRAEGDKPIPAATHKLKAIPLGGLGEFGMNMMAFEYGDAIVVVDSGLMFPDSELLGVDIVVPDITYLRENQSRLKAILLTHGHEDHIGALPYVLDDVQAPVYGTPFTLALARSKLEEHGLADKVELREMLPSRPFEVGPFHVEFIHLTHSIIEAGAIALTTPAGTIIHTGDFKFDPTPMDGRTSDLHTL